MRNLNGLFAAWLLAFTAVAHAQVMPGGSTAPVANQAVCYNGTRLDQIIPCGGSGTTGSLGGGALLAGACASTTVAITGSTTAMGVVATPATYPGDGNYWYGYVSTNGTVTVKVCAAIAGTPAASTYNVRVLQ